MAGIPTKEEMNQVIREVYSNPNRQNRSALTPEQISRYVDDVIAALPSSSEKSAALEFLLKLLVFDLDVQAHFIIDRELLGSLERLDLGGDSGASDKRKLILFVVRKLLGKDVISFGDEFIFELKRGGQQLINIVISPDELPSSNPYLYHKYLEILLDQVEKRYKSVTDELKEVLLQQGHLKQNFAQQSQQLQDEAAELKRKLEELEKISQGLPAKIEEVSTTVQKKLTPEINGVKDQITMVKTLIDAKHSEAIHHINDIEGQLRKQLPSFATKEELNQHREETRGSIAVQEQQLDQHRKETRGSIEELKQELNQHREETRRSIEELKELLKGLGERLDKFDTKLEQKIDESQSQLIEKHQQLHTQVQDIHSKHQGNYDVLQKQIEGHTTDSSQRIQELETRVAQIGDDLSELREQNQNAVGAEIDSLTSKLEKWQTLQSLRRTR